MFFARIYKSGRPPAKRNHSSTPLFKTKKRQPRLAQKRKLRLLLHKLSTKGKLTHIAIGQKWNLHFIKLILFNYIER